MRGRVAILAHSTNPRGGVVHALELGDALTRLGHQAVVHAPDATGRGFFRASACETRAIRATSMKPEGGVGPATHALVQTRVADYVRHFESPAHRAFGLFHAQDGISGNALATLKSRGLIEGFARTVHHIDAFEDPRVAALQDRAIVEADLHFVVSPLWRRELLTRYGIEATVVGNGVDTARFSPRPQPVDLLLRRGLGLRSGPVFLAIGGIEERKNTIRMLEAFVQVHGMRPDAQLVIAGGSSLLDHGAYQRRFAETLAASGLPDHAVLRIGTVIDDDMPVLYRNADTLVFPSLKEGFGLVVLEAMASGLPVVTSAIEPFTTYLTDEDATWCSPDHPGSIADAMMLALLPQLRTALIARGQAVAGRHGWDAVAARHLASYATRGAPAYA